MVPPGAATAPAPPEDENLNPVIIHQDFLADFAKNTAATVSAAYISQKGLEQVAVFGSGQEV